MGDKLNHRRKNKEVREYKELDISQFDDIIKKPQKPKFDKSKKKPHNKKKEEVKKQDKKPNNKPNNKDNKPKNKDNKQRPKQNKKPSSK